MIICRYLLGLDGNDDLYRPQVPGFLILGAVEKPVSCIVI
jgi:hypothetical protein